MILKEFSKYLLSQEGGSALKHLNVWLIGHINNPNLTKVNKVIQKEITFAKNAHGNFLLIGKSSSGRRLLESLYNFACAFENQEHARFIHNLKPKDFENF